MKRKYEFTGETKEIELEIIVRRIVRISDGLIGGWIQGEHNLSHEGECFVYDEAQVSGRAIVSEDASIKDFARVFSDARVYGRACISGRTKICGYSEVFDNAEDRDWETLTFMR